MGDDDAAAQRQRERERVRALMQQASSGSLSDLSEMLRSIMPSSEMSQAAQKQVALAIKLFVRFSASREQAFDKERLALINMVRDLRQLVMTQKQSLDVEHAGSAAQPASQEFAAEEKARLESMVASLQEDIVLLDAQHQTALRARTEAHEAELLRRVEAVESELRVTEERHASELADKERHIDMLREALRMTQQQQQQLQQQQQFQQQQQQQQRVPFRAASEGERNQEQKQKQKQQATLTLARSMPLAAPAASPPPAGNAAAAVTVRVAVHEAKRLRNSAGSLNKDLQVLGLKKQQSPYCVVQIVKNTEPIKKPGRAGQVVGSHKGPLGYQKTPACRGAGAAPTWNSTLEWRIPRAEWDQASGWGVRFVVRHDELLHTVDIGHALEFVEIKGQASGIGLDVKSFLVHGHKNDFAGFVTATVTVLVPPTDTVSAMTMIVPGAAPAAVAPSSPDLRAQAMALMTSRTAPATTASPLKSAASRLQSRVAASPLQGGPAALLPRPLANARDSPPLTPRTATRMSQDIVEMTIRRGIVDSRQYSTRVIEAAAAAASPARAAMAQALTTWAGAAASAPAPASAAAARINFFRGTEAEEAETKMSPASSPEQSKEPPARAGSRRDERRTSVGATAAAAAALAVGDTAVAGLYSSIATLERELRGNKKPRGRRSLSAPPSPRMREFGLNGTAREQAKSMLLDIGLGKDGGGVFPPMPPGPPPDTTPAPYRAWWEDGKGKGKGGGSGIGTKRGSKADLLASLMQVGAEAAPEKRRVPDRYAEEVRRLVVRYVYRHHGPDIAGALRQLRPRTSGTDDSNSNSNSNSNVVSTAELQKGLLRWCHPPLSRDKVIVLWEDLVFFLRAFVAKNGGPDVESAAAAHLDFRCADVVQFLAPPSRRRTRGTSGRTTSSSTTSPPPGATGRPRRTLPRAKGRGKDVRRSVTPDPTQARRRRRMEEKQQERDRWQQRQRRNDSEGWQGGGGRRRQRRQRGGRDDDVLDRAPLNELLSAMPTRRQRERGEWGGGAQSPVLDGHIPVRRRTLMRQHTYESFGEFKEVNEAVRAEAAAARQAEAEADIFGQGRGGGEWRQSNNDEGGRGRGLQRRVSWASEEDFEVAGGGE